MISRLIHQVWIGDQSKRPEKLMNTWRELNPNCEYMMWTEEALLEFSFVNQSKIDIMEDMNGKCDIMRFEILYKYGGFLVDADSECVNALDDFFFDNDRFTCYENEQVGIDTETGITLISEGFMGYQKEDGLCRECIAELGRIDMQNKRGWEVTGNRFFATMIDKWKDAYPMKIYPSWYFIPKHGTGEEYKGDGKIYSKHYWGSTFGLYGDL